MLQKCSIKRPRFQCTIYFNIPLYLVKKKITKFVTSIYYYSLNISLFLSFSLSIRRSLYPQVNEQLYLNITMANEYTKKKTKTVSYCIDCCAAVVALQMQLKSHIFIVKKKRFDFLSSMRFTGGFYTQPSYGK